MTQLQNKRSAVRFTNRNFPEWSMAPPQQRERWHKPNRQSAVLKQQATVPQWALKGSFIVSYQMPRTETTNRLWRSNFAQCWRHYCWNTEGTRLLGKSIQCDSAQHSGPAQDLSRQHPNFCRSSYITQVLHSEWIKAKTATAARLLVYIQYHNGRNSWKKSTTENINKLPVHLSPNLFLSHTQIAMQPLQHFRHRKTFLHTSLQLADLAMVFFLRTPDCSALTNAGALSVDKYSM